MFNYYFVEAIVEQQLTINATVVGLIFARGMNYYNFLALLTKCGLELT